MDNMLDALRIGLEMEAFWQFLSTLRCALQCVTKQIQSIWSEFNDAPIQERESITRHWLTLYGNKKLLKIDLFSNKNYLIDLNYQNLSVDYIFLFILITWLKCYGCWIDCTQHYRLCDCCNKWKWKVLWMIDELASDIYSCQPATYCHLRCTKLYELHESSNLWTQWLCWYWYKYSILILSVGSVSNIPVWIWVFEFNVSHSILYM